MSGLGEADLEVDDPATDETSFTVLFNDLNSFESPDELADDETLL